MASRQNKEARKEYPTGHNKGNDSPDRDVPGTNGGSPRSFGAPVGPPPAVRDTDAEREALLNTTVPPEERRRLLEEADTGSRDETRRAVESEARDRKTEAPQGRSPTANLTVVDAARKLRRDKLETEQADRD